MGRDLVLVSAVLYTHTHLLLEIPCPSSADGEVVHELLHINEVLLPLLDLMKHSLILAAMQ